MCLYCFFLRTRCSTGSTLFPYTTLFRSRLHLEAQHRVLQPAHAERRARHRDVRVVAVVGAVGAAAAHAALAAHALRSEEHTSELQSRLHLVCRLLLEKKKETLQP